MQISDIVSRYRDRCKWEDRIEPPRRYFDHSKLSSLLMKDLNNSKAENEAMRTDLANSKWFTDLV